MMRLTRRQLMTTALATAALPKAGFGNTPREIMWEELVPAGVPYSEIIGEGEVDEVNDYWRPIFDENARKLNPDLNGAYIRMPGFIVPFEVSDAGVHSFLLVPVAGACIHIPPPPANQIVFVTTDTPWPNEDLYEAVWVTGQMSHEIQATEIAEVGYALHADAMEIYVWGPDE